VVLFAHDAAGPQVIDWALTHPERIAALVTSLPGGTAKAARGSAGGAIVAAQHLPAAGLRPVADRLRVAAVHAFKHGFASGCLVAGAAATSAIVVWFVPSASPPSPRPCPTRQEAHNEPKRRRRRQPGGLW